MQLQSRHPILVGVALGDVLSAALALYAAFLIRRDVLPALLGSELTSGTVQLMPQYGVLLLATVPVLLATLFAVGAYKVRRLQTPGAAIGPVLKAFIFSTLFMLSAGYVLHDKTFSRAIILIYLVLATVGFGVTRIIAGRVLLSAASMGFGLANAVIVGTGNAARTTRQILEQRPYLGYRVLGFVEAPGAAEQDPNVPIIGRVGDLPDLIHRTVIEAVFFTTSLEETARFEKVIWQLEQEGKTVHMRGDIVGSLLSRTFLGEFEGIPILTLRSTPADPIALATKRIVDVVGALAGLVIGAPLLLLTAAAIKLDDGGPILYSQERIGRHGRRFRMLKFRSMAVDAEQRLSDVHAMNEMSGPVFKAKNDPRITRTGRWLRRFSIDELPQLLNVLRGEMSLVGPRPPLPHEVEQYERWQRRRLSMKPGLTCLWQVSGRNNIDFDNWMKLDMEYIDNWSLGLDLKIILRTVPVVVMARGAR